MFLACQSFTPSASSKVVVCCSVLFLLATFSFFWPSFDLKNMISTLASEYSGRNGPIQQILRAKKSRITKFYDKFKRVAKNIEGFLIF